MGVAADKAIQWTESGMIPDSVIRRGIRALLRRRLDARGFLSVLYESARM